ncbi:hypothetical protein PgNI_06471, partial [Pyricularia grisea]|uniref:Uncharacterized protein n=1 Tax=Pyricularia grisea TaxID=148305 RepID=A0A6P8B4G0_PYRGI
QSRISAQTVRAKKKRYIRNFWGLAGFYESVTFPLTGCHETLSKSKKSLDAVYSVNAKEGFFFFPLQKNLVWDSHDSVTCRTWEEK